MPAAELWPAVVEVAEGLRDAVYQVAEGLPEPEATVCRIGADRALAGATSAAGRWLPADVVAGMMAEATRIRAEAKAETAALARPGEDPYETRARLLGRGGG